MGGASARVGPGDLLIGGETKTYDGPWSIPEKIRKFSGVSRYAWGTPLSQFSVLGLAYRNRWNSNDQIPLRAVDRGLITRFGQLDPTVIQLSLLNALNRAADDIEYAYTSRLRGETSVGIDDVHFHPAEPRQVRLSVDYRF